MKTKSLKLYLIVCLSFFTLQSFSQLQLPAMFSNNMVLQQKTMVPIWGKYQPNQTLTIITSWDKRKYVVKTDVEGAWETKLQTPKAGGPFEITIMDKNTLTLKNVMIGEVWLCSGQSNMEMPLAGWGKIVDFENEIAKANYPNIRLLQVKKATSTYPLDNIEVDSGSWQECSPKTIGSFSATAYFFGRDLHTSLNVPIGLINTSWGGTRAEAWTSSYSLKMMPEFVEATDAFSRLTVTDTIKADDKLDIKSPHNPTTLYNAMIAPIVPFAIKGAIWYQGESNASRAYQYRTLFPLMINDWRTKWGYDFPFYFVQLANFKERNEQPVESEWAELREAQFLTLNLENTGMATIIDIGEAGDIHPKNKQDVGKRLSLLAREHTYGKKIVSSGPLYEKYKLEGNQIRIYFKPSSSKIKSKGDTILKGFSIAGADKKFHWADARIEGDQIVLSSPEVSFPVAVRYAWSDNPECNLYNDKDLPASPFRTDDWHGITK